MQTSTDFSAGDDMAPAISRTENRQILDWARALAALAVCVSHIRNLLLQDYTPGLGAAGKAFYFVTNYGHSAVIVFFVLSGFFVGGSVLRASGESRFSWGSYLADRGTRLWIVLLPALVVTLLWDKTGLLLGHGGFYAGTEGNADQTANVASQLGLATFICNGAFLQTIVCPTYGSNGPLWSLANEFWYYLWFPALLGLALPLNRAARPGSAARFVPSWAIVRFAPALLAIASMALIGGFL
jgi:peptidoglycan/LPS O-acetylase OafA/YrhL